MQQKRREYEHTDAEVERTLRENDGDGREDMLKALRAYSDTTPRDVKQYLDRFVISQERAKKVMAVGVSYHFRRTLQYMEAHEDGNAGNGYIKKNILLIGPTGCGKTYTVQKLSEFAGIPFVTEDVTKFTASGYVGRDLEEVALDLLIKADGNRHLAQVGIVYLDEIDKIARAPYTLGKDVNALEVQRGLLKMLEGSEVAIKTRFGSASLSTRHVLFVAGGAFPHMQDVYSKRSIAPADLINLGFEPEFVGRFPVRVVYKELERDDLVRIMKQSEDSPLKHYKSDFKSWDIDIEFDDSAVSEVAERSHKMGMGARGIVSVLEDALLDYMYELPGRRNSRVVIDADAIRDPEGSLKKLPGG